MNRRHHATAGLRHTASAFVATLLSTQRITPAGRRRGARARAGAGGAGFRATAGQSVGVIVPGPHALGHAHHFRLYSVADDCEPRCLGGIAHVTLCVRRCNYIDDYSGERIPRHGLELPVRPGAGGQRSRSTARSACRSRCPRTRHRPAADRHGHRHRAVSRLRRSGSTAVTRTGRAGSACSTAPMSGLELLYMNDERDDFGEYYDRATFQAFKALSPRPHWADPIAMDYAIEERADEVRDMLAGETLPGVRRRQGRHPRDARPGLRRPGRLDRCVARAQGASCAPSGAGSSWCTEGGVGARHARQIAGMGRSCA